MVVKFEERMRNGLVVLLLVLSVNAFSQNGIIQGVVRDNIEDTTLYRAKVFIKGTSLGAYSGMIGKYPIKYLNKLNLK